MEKLPLWRGYISTLRSTSAQRQILVALHNVGPMTDEAIRLTTRMAQSSVIQARIKLAKAGMIEVHRTISGKGGRPRRVWRLKHE